MKHSAASSPSNLAPGITACLLFGAILAASGCVSQRAYEQARAEADELARTLDATRADVQELDHHIAQLQAANQAEDAAATELRAAIQREADMLPVLRRRASERLTSLQAQVVTLVNQSRMLSREVSDARQQRSSLKALVAQYKQEAEDARSLPEPSTVEVPMPATAPPVAAAPISPPAAAPIPITPPQQMAQVTPVTPVKPQALPRPVQTPPAPVDETWFDMVMSWIGSVWDWIAGLFS
jgi:FtsZ-binding cell division protein ZapB